MFRITRDPSSGSPVQCLAKNIFYNHSNCIYELYICASAGQQSLLIVTDARCKHKDLFVLSRNFFNQMPTCVAYHPRKEKALLS